MKSKHVFNSLNQREREKLFDEYNRMYLNPLPLTKRWTDVPKNVRHSVSKVVRRLFSSEKP